MKANLLLAILGLSISGCSISPLKETPSKSGILASDNEVVTLKAVVPNPLPQCDSVDRTNRKRPELANLSLPKSTRGYVRDKEGNLCKK